MCLCNDRSLQLRLIEVSDGYSILGDTANSNKGGVDRETGQIFQSKWPNQAATDTTEVSTEQHMGHGWEIGDDFCYCGSIGQDRHIP